ncbi:2-oxoglutarate and iron-dependent oxygenase domain-containing protein CP2 isoform X3 [Aegilops tauschii subsp. strangulata]|uniref:2-oxoglutarate and iron-dependent oxygenase domain-containing protein CP2 isoform X3 n=1 Tax=Aegilops tauschii subsp. strangulata TaxID=200361 RepID=UPI001ABC979A|nr:2-oxoglutarate and iron-dependent oxygenase domain-containing protein CP2 isoform X3 [Aegilops tauschii subsp. strangulata]
MALEGPAERRDEGQQGGMANGNGVAPPPSRMAGRPLGAAAYSDRRLRLNPNTEHKPQDYTDVRGEYAPAVYSALERHLPPSLLEADRDVKLHFMRDILARYWPHGERNKPLHQELYSMHPSAFFLPTFLEAVRTNTEESIASIMTEPIPGVFSFAMLQPNFCDMLLEEVENFEKWVHAMKFKIMRPNTMNKYGAVLDDFGLEAMLNQFMEEFIAPISKVFYPEVGGGTLDSHHAFVVEYGKDRDVELGFHVDDSEVTLNVCLGKQFSGGELYFRGIRCENHVNSETQHEEMYDYSHVPGRAVLHRGRHRHGARPTSSGLRMNLLLWCRSSVFREMKKYQMDFSSWCGECQREKRERQIQCVKATKLAFLRGAGGAMI